jgi:nitroreductase
VEAPLLLGVCAIPEKSWVRRDGRYYGDVDAAIVMDHIILAATGQGLGTCWVAAFKADAAKEVLELDESMELIALTPIGYASTTPPERKRKPLEELVIYK